jgi:hypothetical protein
MFEYYKKGISYYKMSTTGKNFTQVNCSDSEYAVVRNFNAGTYDALTSFIPSMTPSTEEEFEEKKATAEEAITNL